MTDAASPLPGVSTPVDQILFHVRLIDPWQTSPSQPQQSRWSFFGLELELRGRRQTGSNGDEQASEKLEFTSTARARHHDNLREVTGPFTLAVQSKMPLDGASDVQKAQLQLLVPVQTHNTLARINKDHFLQHCTTGADVFRALERVVDTVSVAKPFELTFLRHNHAQAAAKIRPFAARTDVQTAQVAQFQKLQADESQWPDERKRRKQFVLQQLDFYREHYLYDHIGAQLQSLHEEIMGSGQWHAYEFEKVLWYYHASTGHLYAEHPMRNNEKTRQLIGGVQLRTRVAAMCMQRGARRLLRVLRAANAATTRLLDTVADEVLTTSFDAAWEARITSAYVDHLKANTGKAAKTKTLWRNWAKRAVINAKLPVQDRSQEEEDLASAAVDRVLNLVCDELFNASTISAWDACTAEALVGHLKANATIAAKAKKLWEKWGHHSVAQANAERQAQAEDNLAQAATERLLNTISDEVLLASIPGAWEACVVNSYVGHLKSNASKTAQTKRLWEKWGHYGVAMAKTEHERARAEDKMVLDAVERVLSVIFEELLIASTLSAWEACVVESYATEQKERAANAANAQKLWDKWSRHGLAKPNLEPHVELVDSMVQTVDPEPAKLVLTSIPVCTASTQTSPSVETATPHALASHVASPESVVAELPIVGESRAVAVTPELTNKPPAISTIPLGGANESRRDNDDVDDDGEVRNWRSRLRLLKQHQRTHRKAPKRAQPIHHSNLVLAPRSFVVPELSDRSSRLLDFAVDQPTSRAVASLREQRQIRTRSHANADDDEYEDDDVLASAATCSPWRRDGSFRSFHAFFNASSSSYASNHHADATRLPPARRVLPASEKYVSSSSLRSSTLPVVLGTGPSMTTMTVPLPMPVTKRSPGPRTGAYASDSVVKPALASSSPPKKLPYIRRRKP